MGFSLVRLGFKVRHRLRALIRSRMATPPPLDLRPVVDEAVYTLLRSEIRRYDHDRRAYCDNVLTIGLFSEDFQRIASRSDQLCQDLAYAIFAHAKKAGLDPGSHVIVELVCDTAQNFFQPCSVSTRFDKQLDLTPDWARGDASSIEQDDGASASAAAPHTQAYDFHDAMTMPVTPPAARTKAMRSNDVSATLTGANKTWIVHPGDVIGRGGDACADIVVDPSYAAISQTHAKLSYNFSTKSWRFIHLGKNCSVIDGKKLERFEEEAELEDGSKILLPGLELAFTAKPA